MIDLSGKSLTATTLLYPSSVSWPMGFAWSSCVAQDTTVSVLTSSGFDEECIICDSHPLPCCQKELAIVATDDVVFVHRDRETALSRVHSFDDALEANHIPRATQKDETACADIVALGCELASSPPCAHADTKKLWPVLNAIAELQRTRRASPLGLNAVLGVGQWFAILSRPHFSCFDKVYEFVRREPGDLLQPVPRAVLDELLIFAALSPLLTAALDRQWCTTVVATDAAPEFGLGVSVADLPPETVESLGTLSERRGDYIRLSRDGSTAEPEKPRVGNPHRLGLRQEDFRDVLSIRAQRREHSGILELKGVLLGLRWLLRSPARFGSRLLFLIDAKAALCAVAKGRSGSAVFNGTLCSISALLLATGCLMRPLYIPSEDNPADHPSRGRRRRPAAKKVLKKQGFSKPERRLNRALGQLRRQQAFIEECSDFASTSSSEWQFE